MRRTAPRARGPRRGPRAEALGSGSVSTPPRSPEPAPSGAACRLGRHPRACVNPSARPRCTTLAPARRVAHETSTPMPGPAEGPIAGGGTSALSSRDQESPPGLWQFRDVSVIREGDAPARKQRPAASRRPSDALTRPWKHVPAAPRGSGPAHRPGRYSVLRLGQLEDATPTRITVVPTPP